MYPPYDSQNYSRQGSAPEVMRTAEEEFDRRWAHFLPTRSVSSSIKRVTYQGEEVDYYAQELLGEQEEYVPSVLTSELRSALKPKNH